ncbi:S8 family serine peptidase [Phenylobacterium sp.]|uniref:S8 family serine peptidase n=1 Tax=Phenylobacterium sp. TaxID=1871053 RepID=UPI00271A270E|nr:S8 family serine peptidase [Phenylobacterium sp.]MDO8799589.1 S8 family serine peptidase [Phenylobacterium sp.]
MGPCHCWIVGSLSVVAMSVVALPASAQLGGLPSIPGGGGLPMGGFPDLPLPAVAAPRLPTVSGLARQAQSLEGQTLSALRGRQVQALIRDHADVIDVDDHGQAVVRGEVLILSPSPQSLAIARKAGFRVGDETRLEGLDLSTVTLTPPAGVPAREAVRRLQALDPQGQYDFNHIYLGAGTAAGEAGVRAAGGGGSGVRIGLVDGGVAAHPSLGPVEQRGFAPGGLKVSAHGTAVASLMVGRSRAFRGAAPGARLLVADVYGGSPTGGSAAIIAQALAWMARSKVPVINVSLVGPPNVTLRAAVAALTARGHLVVAAVGNDGPAAPPLYPAAYPGVVAVTGVDSRRRVLPEAGRGGHVDFAAPGADMAGASSQGGYVALRGTSFAAPLVAGRLALDLPEPDKADADRAVATLSRQARDLGAQGADPVYGKGLVAFDLRTSPVAVGAGRGVLAGE